jgi:acylaminoacyl-peptidase
MATTDSKSNSLGYGVPAVEDMPKLYSQFAGMPAVSSARFVQSVCQPHDDDQDNKSSSSSTNATVRVTFSQRLPTCNASASFHHLYTRSSDKSSYTQIASLPGAGLNVVCERVSPTGKFIARVVSAKPKAGGESKVPVYRIEVLDDACVIASVSTEGKHGQMYLNQILGGFSWSPDETALVYSAEANPDKSCSFWDTQDGSNEPTLDVEDEAYNPNRVTGAYSNKFDFREHLGEELPGKLRPRLFVVHIAQEKVLPVDRLSKDLALGQPLFSPDGKGIIYVGWSRVPRLLGLRHYNTRPAKIYYTDFDLETEIAASNSNSNCSKDKESDDDKENEKKPMRPVLNLTPDDDSAMCPRLSPDGNKLAYVSVGKGAEIHWTCATLRMLDWNSKECRTVIDVIENPASEDDFTGVWVASGGIGLMPSKIWLADSRHIVFGNRCRIIERIVVVDTDNGHIVQLCAPADIPDASGSLRDIDGSSMLVTFSNPVTPAAVYRIDLDLHNGTLSSGDVAGQWVQVTERCRPAKESARKTLANMWYKILTIKPSMNPDTVNLPFNALYVGPRDPTACDASQLPPLIVFPHGGPHSSEATHFWGGVAFFVATGRAVLLINYRGSAGYGQTSATCLLGLCGTQDVQDCLDAADAVVERKWCDASRLSVFGGSHGGFLTTHLIGQAPDKFIAAASRNPVTNIAHMCSSTDIQDWCLVECGIPSSLNYIPSAEDYVTMFNASPIRYASQVKTPLLLMLGDSDLRCPATQGVDYARVLRGNGKKCRVIMYKDNRHSLNTTIESEGDSWVNGAIWLAGHFDMGTRP